VRVLPTCRGNKETITERTKERTKERKRKERKTDELMTKTRTKKDKEVMLERKRNNLVFQKYEG
jgi:hypothetical protein